MVHTWGTVMSIVNTERPLRIFSRALTGWPVTPGASAGSIVIGPPPKKRGAGTGFRPRRPAILLLQRLQILDQVGLLLRLQAERELLAVMLDHVGEGRETAVVEEPALLVRPQPRERRRAVHVR